MWVLDVDHSSNAGGHNIFDVGGIYVQGYMPIMLKQNKFEAFLIRSQVQYFLWSSIQVQSIQTILIISTVTAQLSILDCLPALLLMAQNGPVFIQRPLIKNISII